MDLLASEITTEPPEGWQEENPGATFIGGIQHPDLEIGPDGAARIRLDLSPGDPE